MDLARHLHETVRRPYREPLPDPARGEGTNLQFAKRRRTGTRIFRSFSSPDEIHVVGLGYRRTLLDGESRLARHQEWLATGHREL